jgi:chromosomal replication initiation ATPase DnaA
MPELDLGFTFENFVVGPANRLASAAARRAAETPGSAYNPLFIYSAPGLGKTHILGAITHQVGEIHPDKKILYQTMEVYLGKLGSALEKGTQNRFPGRYTEFDVLLLDDVQFLTEKPEAQEILLQTLDILTGEGRQVVLGSDRPPIEMEGLDARLRTRFEGGLLVEIGAPEYETQMAIIRKLTEAREQELDPGVADVLGRLGVQNVRELTGALNQVLALQELEERRVSAAEAAAMLKEDDVPDIDGTELGQFLEEISDSVAAEVDFREAPWRKLLREAVEEAEAEEFKADPLRRLLQEESPIDDVGGVVEEFKRTIGRLKGIKEELEKVGNPWPEAAFGVLKDTERLDEAKALLSSARERARAFPEIPEGPDLVDLKGKLPNSVIETADRLVDSGRPEYSPLYVWSPDGDAARVLLQGAGRSVPSSDDGPQVAMISLAGFAEEFNQALAGGVAGAWRERWWSADFLFIHSAQEVALAQRAQDEFVHLLEALQRRKARIMVTADRPPSEVDNIDDRLRTRFEAGLVVEVSVKPSDLPLELLESPEVPDVSPRDSEDIAAQDLEWIRSFTPAAAGASTAGASTAGASTAGASTTGALTARTGSAEKGGGIEAVIAATAVKPDSARPQGMWAPSVENVVWEWPKLEDRIVKDPD